MKKYIFNSAVITSPGRYDYYLIDIEKAKKWLKDRNYESTLGYQETCEALKRLTGVSVPLNRKLVKMEVGDEALVFRLTYRLSDPSLKGKIANIDFILKNSEIGILKRLK